MKASAHLFCQWTAHVRPLLPDLHGHRTQTLAFFVFGVVLSGKARLPLIAEELLAISSAKTPSIERRLTRFLANDQVAVVPLWTCLLAHLLSCLRNQRLELVLDRTPLDARACVGYLGLLVHARLLPVGWQGRPVHETWEDRQWAIVAALLDRVISHVGTAECPLIADSGLAGMPVVQVCQTRQWHDLLRVGRQHTCRPACGTRADHWCAMSELVSRPGQSWVGPARVWQAPHVDAWLKGGLGTRLSRRVVSALGSARRTPTRPRRRARDGRVESSCQDFTRRGWDIEGTVRAHRARLERWLLVLFLGVWWVSHLAAACMHEGQRPRVDRHDRRDKGILRIGRWWLHDLRRRERQAASLAHWLPFHRKGAALAFALRF